MHNDCARSTASGCVAIQQFRTSRRQQNHREIHSKDIFSATAHTVQLRHLVCNRAIDKCKALMSCVGRRFGYLVGNRTIETFTARTCSRQQNVQCPAGSSFGPLVANRTIEKCTALIVSCGQQFRTSCRQQSHREMYSAHFVCGQQLRTSRRQQNNR